jgi:hypothetical protein
LDAQVGFVDHVDIALFVDGEAAGEVSVPGADPGTPAKVEFTLPIAKMAPFGDVSAAGAIDDDAGVAGVEECIGTSARQ